MLAALAGARVFAGLRATSTAEHVEAGTGLRAESSAEMAVVLLEAPDGSRALPVCADLGALRRWRIDARPVRLTGPEACSAALEQGLDAVVIDPGGAAVTLEGQDLAQLAAGWVPVTGSSLATRTAEVTLSEPDALPAGLLDALAHALRDEPVVAARVAQVSGTAELVVGLVLRRDLPVAELAALAQRLRDRLDPALSRELAVTTVPQDGPGVRVPLGRTGRFSWSRRGR